MLTPRPARTHKVPVTPPPQQNNNNIFPPNNNKTVKNKPPLQDVINKTTLQTPYEETLYRQLLAIRMGHGNWSEVAPSDSSGGGDNSSGK